VDGRCFHGLNAEIPEGVEICRLFRRPSAASVQPAARPRPARCRRHDELVAPEDGTGRSSSRAVARAGASAISAGPLEERRAAAEQRREQVVAEQAEVDVKEPVRPLGMVLEGRVVVGEERCFPAEHLLLRRPHEDPPEVREIVVVPRAACCGQLPGSVRSSSRGCSNGRPRGESLHVRAVPPRLLVALLPQPLPLLGVMHCCHRSLHCGQVTVELPPVSLLCGLLSLPGVRQRAQGGYEGLEGALKGNVTKEPSAVTGDRSHREQHLRPLPRLPPDVLFGCRQVCG
jgi:hypothetical protein